MNFIKLFILVLLSLSACTTKKNQALESKNIKKQIVSDTGKSVQLYLFRDSGYFITLKDLESAALDDSVMIYLTFKKNNSTAKVLKSTISCEAFEYFTKDFNGDNIKDLLVLKYRNQSYPSYYLFITDTSNNTIHYVSGFETQVYSPEFDKPHNIISSTLKSGTIYNCNFFRLTSSYQLINLNKGFSTDKMEKIEELYYKKISTIK